MREYDSRIIDKILEKYIHLWQNANIRQSLLRYIGN